LTPFSHDALGYNIAAKSSRGGQAFISFIILVKWIKLRKIENIEIMKVLKA